MKAARIHRFGPPDVIELEETDRPTPGENEVLVRVMAASVGPWDAWIRAGKSVLPQPLPLTLGSDFSGIVELLGKGVSRWVPGMEVFGVTNKRFVGAYAEYAVASAGMIAPKPQKLGHVEASSVPVIAVTAWQMLFEYAKVNAGQTVLITGAAGNVGSYAVQLAKAVGARTVATVRSHDVDYARSLGSDEVVDFDSEEFKNLSEAVDVVIDTVGPVTHSKAFDVLKPGGVFVSAVSPPDPSRAKQREVKAGFMLVNVTTEHLMQIATRFDAQKLRTDVGTVLSLDAAQEAHEMLERTRKHSRGKIVLSVV